MKPCRLRPLARRNRREEVGYYRREAGSRVANRLVDALETALHELELNPGIGSPTLGKVLGIDALRTWRIDGLPMPLWYFEREDHIDVIHLIGHRQDAESVAADAE